MTFPIFKELFNKAIADGSRSTALKPVHWITGLVLFALLIGAWKGFPDWLLYILVLLLIVCVGLFIYSYCFLLHNNPDALRSETYTLQKMSLEKGIVGDSIHGVLTPSEKNKTKLITTDPDSSNNET